MAGNNYVARFIADTGQFDNSIRKSKGSLLDFMNTGKAGEGIMGGLTKSFNLGSIALKAMPWAAVGAAIGGFIKMGMEAGQASTNFNQSIDAAKSTLQSFAGALISMNWDTFNGGIMQAYRNSKLLQQQLEMLQNIELSKSVYDKRVQNDFNEFLNDARDTTLSLAERQAAYNRAVEANLGLQGKTKKAIDINSEAAKSFYKEKTGWGVTDAMLVSMIENLDEVEIGIKLIPEANKNSFSDAFNQLHRELKTTLGATNLSRDQFERLLLGWNKLNKEARQELGQYVITSEGYRQQIIANERTLTKVKASLEKGDGTGTGTGTGNKTTPDEKPLKTLQDLQNEAENLRTKLAQATDPYVIQQLNTELKKVEETIKKATFTLDVKPIETSLNFNPVLMQLQGEMGKVKQEMKNATSLTEWEALNNKLKELEKTYKSLNEAIAGGSNIRTLFDPSAINAEMQARIEANRAIAKSDYERAMAAANAANIQRDATFGLIESLGYMIDMNDLSAASFLRMVSKILPQIATLVAAKNTQTIAETTSSGGSAGGIPGAIAGLAVGLGLVASILSATTKPKFAGGGIVGDTNIARVNQGEMILNSRQQHRLFNTINSGNSNNQQSPVEFVIRGQDLIGMQKNYNSKFNR